MSEPLVLIPGFMADGRIFADQIGPLSTDRAVMVAPLLGDGLAEMAEAVLRNAPPTFALAGHDLGASVATEILRRAPDRVTRLALICASAQAATPLEAGAREPRMVKAKAGRLGEALMEDMPIASLHESPHRAAIRDYWLEMALSKGVDAYVHQSRLAQRRPDLQSVLRRARLPALVVGGAADTVCPPRRQDFMAQLMPRADFVLLEKAGHLPMLETPQSLTRALSAWLVAKAPFLLK